ncbi:NmrA family NAD(P)-binding protein [Streptomyces noursei]|uniref:NmrA family transcriptional regulator n=1 Tax=Streptomyces noursei TaxID=1971 RepID=A0A401QUL5_STRNR|nr:NmrA family NAD(P)-binding protein [Streptomyces noursei]EOS97649.1 NmrA family protein [Streptomyces noursei CCRC 11814]EXU92700.1 NmrA family protein [Streptomyces noursei PD-1]UWS70384.1 NmrA family NAD(P)-binding protein [Streptomyces noursei]GCB89096.1 NmrA family transcriptional regulator [Streptomyces noursei]
MPTDRAPVLVTGATGRQGGVTARALLAAGVPVRALVRDAATDRAKTVEAFGAELITGDLHDRDSVIRAAEGARAVFSVQMPDITAEGFDFEGEVAQGVNLIEGAKAAGVRQFVHTSVTGAGQHTETPGWAEGRWASMEPALGAKTAIQDRVRAAGFPHWTLLKPGFFMENFLPSMAFLFPRGIAGGLVSVLNPETRLSLVAVDDIGRAAAAALTAPERFGGVELELASDYLSMTEIAEVLSRALGTQLSAPDMTEEEAIAAGMPAMGATHEWLNVTGQPGRPQYARDLGIPLTGFEEWTRQHMRPTA